MLVDRCLYLDIRLVRSLQFRCEAHGLNISQLTLLDPPPSGAKARKLAPQLTELIAAGRRGEAVELFQTEVTDSLLPLLLRYRNTRFPKNGAYPGIRVVYPPVVANRIDRFHPNTYTGDLAVRKVMYYYGETAQSIR